MMGTQIQSVAMGWHLYSLARNDLTVEQSALHLGLLGLASFTPLFLLALPAGWAADRLERRGLAAICLAGEAVTVSILLWATEVGVISVPLLIGVAVLFGVARAFIMPTITAMGPMLVSREMWPRAIALNSLAGQSGAVMGPAVGGILVAFSPDTAYAAALALHLIAAIAVVTINADTRPKTAPGSPLALVKEGLVYIWREKIVFGAISLDLFAVLLGGATALLPVFAKDVLHVGPEGFGILRASPAIGAVAVALILASRPLHRHAGPILFGSVALFGLATIVFGLSKIFPLSVAALLILGGADMVSVFVRQTLVQIATPDHMRGRVAAVSTLFIGASNELGEFESGVVARFLGPVGAAIFGGVGAIIVTGAWAKLFPDLRKADKLT